MQELTNLYIRQTDYTIDFLGYFIMMSLHSENSENKFNMLRAIGTAIGMQYSRDYSQLVTSIQFEAFEGNIQMERLKVYTKWTHLLLMTSFKAKLSMGTGKLLKPRYEFQLKKLRPSLGDGLTRIELSSYFHSVFEWQEKSLNVDHWK